MALPTILQSRDIQNDRQTIDNLRSQTEILQRISNAMFKNNQGQEYLRKDIANLKKQFMEGTDEFRQLKKYFQESKEQMIKVDKAKPSRESGPGIFKSAIGKLLGIKQEPAALSEVQTRLLEETKFIKNLDMLSLEKLNMIGESFTEDGKAKDRALLAKEIAKEMDGGGGGGFFGTIGKAIIGALGAVATTIVTQLGSIFRTSILSLASILRELIDAVKMIGVARALNPNMPTPDVDKSDRTKPAPGQPPDVDKGKPKARFSVPTWLKNLGVATGIGATIAGLGELITSPSTRYDEPTEGTTPEDTQTPPAKPGQKEYEIPNTPAPVPKPDDGSYAEAEKQRFLRQQDEALKAEKARAEKSEESTIMDKFKQMIDSDMSSLGMAGISGQGITDFLNKLGELQLGENKVNLLPGLGTASAKVLDDMSKTLGDLKDAAVTGGTAVVNQVTNTQVNNGSGTTIFSGATPIDDHPAVMKYLQSFGGLR